MQSRNVKGEKYLLKLTRGERVIESLLQFAREKNIQGGLFHGIGALEDAEVGFYNLAIREYRFKHFPGILELASMTGNIALVDGNPFVHAHVVLSDDEMQAFGGHLKEAIVGVTCEIHLSVLQEPLIRIHEEEVGLNLWQI